MDRIILHSDMNCFYASVELLYHPEYRGRPLAVAGDVENRHGIILTKSQKAKEAGVSTGEAIWEARQKCPDLILVPPDFPKYIRFSQKARAIYYRYTNQVESFGLDEAWLDLTGTAHLLGDGMTMAKKISHTIKEELGLTVSIGVSYNKIFAKFGSDYQKPDAITAVTRDNYQHLVWDAPVADLLYCGRATTRKLKSLGITTIGQLAHLDDSLLTLKLGKMGLVLKAFALGADTSPVKDFDPHLGDTPRVIKSIGNGYTAPRDLVSREDVALMTTILAESVAMRLRQTGLEAHTLSLHIRNKDLHSISRQKKLPQPSDITEEFIQCAMALFDASYTWDAPIRSLTLKVSDLLDKATGTQLSFFVDPVARQKKSRLDHTVDDLRRRFGNLSIRRGNTLTDGRMCDLDPKKNNTVHPVSYFH